MRIKFNQFNLTTTTAFLYFITYYSTILLLNMSLNLCFFFTMSRIFSYIIEKGLTFLPIINLEV